MESSNNFEEMTFTDSEEEHDLTEEDEVNECDFSNINEGNDSSRSQSPFINHQTPQQEILEQTLGNPTEEEARIVYNQTLTVENLNIENIKKLVEVHLKISFFKLSSKPPYDKYFESATKEFKLPRRLRKEFEVMLFFFAKESMRRERIIGEYSLKRTLQLEIDLANARTRIRELQEMVFPDD